MAYVNSSDDSVAERTTTDVVANVDEMQVGTMKMARVGDRRLAIVRTDAGYHALDNACPHQGYGLVTGTLEGDLVTCQWHNWKYCVTDGKCVVGEEDVATHPVEIVGNEVHVSVTEPTNDERLEALWPSLESGIKHDYAGQITRDVARLLDAGADPVDIVWTGIRLGSPRAEWGVDHEMAMAADCLTFTDDYEGLDRALPISHALTGISEQTRGRLPYPVGDAVADVDFAAAVEREDLDAVVGALMTAFADGTPMETVRSWFVEAVGAHHLDYGHGAIYTQKAFELLDKAGWERAAELLPHLATSIVYGTREDTLPYMRQAARVIDSVDGVALAAAGRDRDPQWDSAPLIDELLTSQQAPIASAVAAVADGAGIEGLLDAVTLAVSERLLRYDVSSEFDTSENFNWLQITHGLTYSRAARWAWQHHPGAASARLALFTVFLCFDTGRKERRTDGEAVTKLPEPAKGDLEAAIAARDPELAVAIALGGDIDEVGKALGRASMEDRSGSFIVLAHQIKMAKAAAEEAEAIGSNLPLAATARFAAGERRERFVSRNVAESIRFVQTGQPPTR